MIHDGAGCSPHHPNTHTSRIFPATQYDALPILCTLHLAVLEEHRQATPRREATRHIGLDSDEHVQQILVRGRVRLSAQGARPFSKPRDPKQS